MRRVYSFHARRRASARGRKIPLAIDLRRDTLSLTVCDTTDYCRCLLFVTLLRVTPTEHHRLTMTSLALRALLSLPTRNGRQSRLISPTSAAQLARRKQRKIHRLELRMELLNVSLASSASSSAARATAAFARRLCASRSFWHDWS